MKKARQSKTPRQIGAPAGTKAARGKAKERDPVETIRQTNEGRLQELVPIRHSRMMVSPFTFYRGAAAIMAEDLSKLEHSGIIVQSCGDAHVLNCGAFATPERNVIIDINDFDETLPAPFEWDLKRLSASFVIACESVNLPSKLGQKAAYQVCESYQKEMANYAKQRLLDVWYQRLDYQSFVDKALDRQLRKFRSKQLEKEITKSAPEALQQKLTVKTKKGWRFKDMPPLLYRPPDVGSSEVANTYEQYLESISDDRRSLLSHFEVVDWALKVVGTGSVGTFCGVLLLVGPNEDLLMLQIKEARQSVLEPFLEKSRFEHEGQRVVTGQRIMQSASDMFLGWTTGKKGRHFYLRQLRDVKLSPTPQFWNKKSLPDITRFAGQVLAKAHAKSGEASTIANYIGKSDKFITSIAKFALDYARQNDEDYDFFSQACRAGLLPTEASMVG